MSEDSRAAAALDAAECACELREELGDVPHLDFDFVDPSTGHLEHDCLFCPWCELRYRASIYRALTCAPIIEASRNAKPKLFSRDPREIAKFNIEARSLRSRYDGGDPQDRTDEYGEVAPEARTVREQIDIAATLKAMTVAADMHHAKALALGQRRVAKQSEIDTQREMLSQWRTVP
jgi:hypothetical protein